MHKFWKTSSVIVLNGIAINSVFATENLDNINADQRYLYIKAEYGLSEPVKNKFMHESSKTNISLKKSAMYGGRIGYSFYPQMAIELSATFQPKYKLGYLLGETANTAKIPGKTKVASESYMLNFVYDLGEYKGFTPFVSLGAGVARIKIKPTTSKAMLNDATKAGIQAQAQAQIPAPFATNPQAIAQATAGANQYIAQAQDQEIFRVKRSAQNCNAWQVGLGVSKNLANNFSVDLAGRLQVVHSVKINYDIYNLQTSAFEKQPAIKKTIGVWEVGVGFTYKLPV